MALLSRIKTKLAQCETVNHERKCQQMIERNYKVFKKLRSRAMTEKDENRRIKKIRKAATWAVTNHTGLFSCNQLEEALCQIAQKHSIPLNTPQKNTVLHILTTAYKTGGHTRVADKWIAYAPKTEIHSLALIDQEMDDEPEFLYETVREKGGQTYHLNKDSTYLEKALELRELASGFEKVVLHVHMNDPVPILAFGTEEFTSPIIFYNHAEHIFWLGVSISDIVADLSMGSQQRSFKRRGCAKGALFPVPIKATETFPLKIQARSLLGFSAETDKIVISIGAKFRYKPIPFCNFVYLCESLLKNNPDLIIIIIGCTERDKIWSNLFKKYGAKRLMLLGKIADKQTYKNYVAAADIYIESFPLGAETTSLEVAIAEKPIFMLKSLLTRSSVWDNYYYDKVSAMTDGINKYLRGDTDIDPTLLKESVIQQHGEAAALGYIYNIDIQTPNKHIVHRFNSLMATTDYDILIQSLAKPEHIFGKIKFYLQKKIKKLTYKRKRK